MAGRSTGTSPSARRRQCRTRALVVGALAIVAASIVTATTLVVGSDQSDDRVAPPKLSATTAPTTTTLPRSPEAVRPPSSAEATAEVLIRVERGIRGADRDPERLRVMGWEQQLAYRQLSNHAEWLPTTLAALPADVRYAVDANLTASTALSSLTPPETQLPDWTIRAPLPAETLRGYYAEAEQASGTPWAYLAAIHFLETRFGRIHGNSSAGAQGPMQFISSTWSAYGNGGDVNSDHDAILAAGRYLRAAGAPALMDRAIYAYNHDDGYVAAVTAYARVMLTDPRAYDGYYAWQVYYRTVDETVLLPEGYTAGGPIGVRPLPPA